MELQKIKLDDIKPAEYNPRLMDIKEFKKLSNSIHEYGLVDPILVNLKNMTIVGGHQRYTVMLEEHEKDGSYDELLLFPRGDIGWVFTEDNLIIRDDAHEKGLNIALNKISGVWDYTKLNPLLDDLLDVSGFDINLTGFDDLDLVGLDVDLDSLDIGDDLSDGKINNKGVKLLVTCEDVESQELLYHRLTKEGYDCKVFGK